MQEAILEWSLCLLAGLLLADFASGVIHWIIDRYCEPAMPLAGKHFVALIHEHHRAPLAMFRLTLVRRNAGFAIIVGTIFGLFTVLQWLNPVAVSAFVFGAFANQIHCWAHRRPKLLWPFIRPLQMIGLLQSPRHHALHHGSCPNRHYCLITNFVNPVVDRLNLWKLFEQALLRLGIPPKDFVLPNPTYAATTN